MTQTPHGLCDARILLVQPRGLEGLRVVRVAVDDIAVEVGGMVGGMVFGRVDAVNVIGLAYG